MAELRLSIGEARRIAVRAQLLSEERPAGIVPVVEHLGLLQNEPTAAIAPAADLVLWSRLGGGYRPEQLERALEDGRLFEHDQRILPTSQLELYLPEMAAWPPWQQTRDWLEANEPFRRDVLDLLEESGPLTSSELPDTSVVPWQSSGWSNDRNVSQLLECLAKRGEIAIAGRRRGQKLWDLAERVWPATTSRYSADEARQLRAGRRLRALGIMRPKLLRSMFESLDLAALGVEAEVEGLPGTWRVHPEWLDGRSRSETKGEGRTVLVSPFDRLVFDRDRLRELFGFEYTLEMYKPAAKRRWGYYALPILHGDRFVGKLDAIADRRAGVLRVNAIHWDVADPPADEVDAEIAALARWLGLTELRP